MSWLVVLPECESTNTWVVEHAEALANGACVQALQQTAGRGRQGKSWDGSTSITASFCFQQFDLTQTLQAPLVVGLAVALCLEDHGLAHAAIKWPNDIYVQDRKCAGILCEQSGSTLIVGIGLNRQTPATMSDTAIGFAEAGVKDATDLAILTSIRQYLLEGFGLLQTGNAEALHEQLHSRDWLRGKTITVSDGNHHITGIANGIDTNGHLLVTDKHHHTHPLRAGSVRFDCSSTLS